MNKYDVNKLVPVCTDLSELSDVVKNEVVRTNLNNQIVKKVNTVETTDTSDLVKKADYDTEIYETKKEILHHNHDKYITTQKFNKLTADNFAVRLVVKLDISDFVEKTDFDDKVKNLDTDTSHKTKDIEP